MSIVVVGLEDHRQNLVRTIRSAAAGHPVVSATKPAHVESNATASLMFVDGRRAPSVLQILKSSGSRARVMVLDSEVRAPMLKLALASARVVGLATAPDGIPPFWEVSYVTRRVIAPGEPTPSVSDLVPWGATNIAWNPRTTEDLRRIVTQIETMARNLGCDRREATTVSTAAHELLMNAMYDAPVGPDGTVLYAQNRQQALQLDVEHAPLFRFTLSADYVGLDVTDPFGRLPRNRFFEGVVRGHQNMTGEGAPVLDTSHGGAGLGLHTLYSSGSLLRAELRPLKQTHVSWMLARKGSGLGRSRSLYFAPLVNT